MQYLFTPGAEYILVLRLFLLGGILIAVLTHFFGKVPGAPLENNIYYGTLIAIFCCTLFQAAFFISETMVLAEVGLLSLCLYLIARDWAGISEDGFKGGRDAVFAWYFLFILFLYGAVALNFYE